MNLRNCLFNRAAIFTADDDTLGLKRLQATPNIVPASRCIQGMVVHAHNDATLFQNSRHVGQSQRRHLIGLFAG